MKSLIKISFLLSFLAISILSFAQDSKVFANADGIANGGYDVVNYFTSYTAQRGSKTHSTEYNGTTYYFANAENLKAFTANPGKYLPQYDGYCAFAVAKMNKKVPTDPRTFLINDGKLYLFYNDYWEGAPLNTIVPWVNDEKNLVNLAEANWPKIQ
jgi:YHS domain-containing protein